jgi:hypothetical protein
MSIGRTASPPEGWSNWLVLSPVGTDAKSLQNLAQRGVRCYPPATASMRTDSRFPRRAHTVGVGVNDATDIRKGRGGTVLTQLTTAS